MQLAIHEMNKDEPEYMEILGNAYSTIADKVTLQGNPYYSMPSDKRQSSLCCFT